MGNIKSHKDLRVYQLSFDTGMEAYELSKSFPKEELYSLTDQIRRSSRSVSGNISEAWRKRRYEESFIAKVNDSESEAAETQVWLEYAFACKYISEENYKKLYEKYDYYWNDSQYEQQFRQMETLISEPPSQIFSKSHILKATYSQSHKLSNPAVA